MGFYLEGWDGGTVHFKKIFFVGSGGIVAVSLGLMGFIVESRKLSNGHAVQGGDPWVAQEAYHRYRT